MNKIPTITLNNKNTMPMIGLGTYRTTGDECTTIKEGIEKGYRHIDTATLYENEAEIGKVLKEMILKGTIKREDIFITTKVWFTDLDNIKGTLQQSLNKLQLDYVDLYLIHWPVKVKSETKQPYKDEDFLPFDTIKIWKEMEELVDLKLTKSIGVSNFQISKLKTILEHCRIKPVCNQIEMNIHLQRKELVSFCQQHDIVIVCYRPLSANLTHESYKHMKNHCLEDKTVIELSTKYNKTPSQICLRFLIEMNCIPIPKSQNIKHIEDNFNIFNFKIEENDMKKLKECDLNLYTCGHFVFGTKTPEEFWNS